MTKWNDLAERVIEGEEITQQEALEVVEAPDSELLAILDAAYTVRAHHHGDKVRIHVLQNAKSGVCPEDCSFCSQSMEFDNDVEQYGMQRVDEILEGAKQAYEKGAATYCVVTATRGPVPDEIEIICEATRKIKEEYPMEVCASLGLLKEGQAEKLAEAGVDKYNHNLETSSSHFENVVSTHDFEDRVRTVKRAKEAGMSACCGGILGLDEERNDWVELAFALRDLEVESVPVNFLNPRPGTPLEDAESVTARDALKALAMFRFVHPAADVRMSGGREVILDQMQPLALYAANSFFTEGYLTTPGQGDSEDYKMLQQAGFEPVIVGDRDEVPEPEMLDEQVESSSAGGGCCGAKKASGAAE